MSERPRRGQGTVPYGFVLLTSVLFTFEADAFVSFPRCQISERTRLSLTASSPTLIEHANDLIGIFGIGDHDDSDLMPLINSSCTQRFPQSKNQVMSIKSKSPAVLLTSGPGTGKTHTLASRVAYLLNEELCPPQKMVIMSFSNRDADLLKSKAINQVFISRIQNVTACNLTKEELRERLWGGTIHKFAANIIRVYSTSKSAVRVLSNHEAKMRIEKCLRLILDVNQYKEQGQCGSDKLKEVRLIHRDALMELRQSRDVLMHQVGRCIELWKESAMLTPPSVHGINIATGSYPDPDEFVRNNCMELATRLGITRNVAMLAWLISPLYQNLHERHGTVDPADLVPLAYHLLLSNPKQLSKLRSKLSHIILDEYQDISVAQHTLIRLVVRGVLDELKGGSKIKLHIPPVLARRQKRESIHDSSFVEVPSLFCAGDMEQSIYGFRGAAPQLSVDGFRNDFPQGIVAHLDKSFRLSRDVWSTVSMLISDDGRQARTKTFQKSPVGLSKARSTLFNALSHSTSEHQLESLKDFLTEELSDAMTGSIHVQGVWDCREEAKHIAMMIRRRAKDRTERLSNAWKISFKGKRAAKIADPSEVAIIVRAGNQLDLIKEALGNAGLTYVDVDGSVREPIKRVRIFQMKPVVLITMHGSKGEEFDDIYLPGWTEGVFPHPSAVSSNRIDEERRLAYVAISRARDRVHITHAFVRRVLHTGKNLGQKMVTMQVRPSRFLYELVPNGAYSTNNKIDNSDVLQHLENEKQLPTITWDRSRGSKGGFAGTNLPEHFIKSYDTPRGFTPPEYLDQELLIMERQLELVKNLNNNRDGRAKVTSKRNPLSRTQSSPINLTATNVTGHELEQVLDAVNEILAGKHGSCTKHRKSFLCLLKNNFRLSRGKITLFPFMAELKSTKSVLSRTTVTDLFETQWANLATRPLSQSTALELGLFLLFSLRDHADDTVAN